MEDARANVLRKLFLSTTASALIDCKEGVRSQERLFLECASFVQAMDRHDVLANLVGEGHLVLEVILLEDGPVE